MHTFQARAGCLHLVFVLRSEAAEQTDNPLPSSALPQYFDAMFSAIDPSIFPGVSCLE